MTKAKKYILEYLSERGELEEPVEIINYVEEGFLDSMEVFVFTIELERQFDISFSEEEINLPEFRRVGKLIEIVEQKLQDKETYKS